MLGRFVVLATVGAAQILWAQDTAAYRCEVQPKAGRNSEVTPAWIVMEVDFYSGDARIEMPGIGGKSEITASGRIDRDTDELFSVKWRALAELGYYSKTSIIGHRISVNKGSGSARYRSETIRGRGNLSGTARCRRQ